MGEGLRRCLGLVACIVLFASCAALAPGNAAADSTDPGSGAEQTSDSSASSSAQNDNSTTQSATATQTGGDGQSQTIVQSAPTEQSATASATSNQSATNQSATNDPAGGSPNQGNGSAAAASANNANHTNQGSTQEQSSGAPPPDPAPGQAQTSSHSAPVTQKADAEARSTQMAPRNVNVVIRIDSPGEEGPVTQTNTSVASATGNNSNATNQDATQNQTGGGGSAGQSQWADQSAPTTQSGSASAISNQVAPLNANIVIRNKSPGDTGPVTQTNSSQATAQAANDNGLNQSAMQTQTLAGDGTSSGQSQSVSQSAPTAQDANATAVSTQSAPTNANVSILIDGAALDPAGSGVLGALIQIWIPLAEEQPASQANTSSATASAENTNRVTQSATQLQSGGSDGGSQLEGAGQSQTIEQSAPTTQTANAHAATSEQAVGTGSSSATATQKSSSQTAQSAQQIGPGTQVIEQTALSTHAEKASATPGAAAGSMGGDGWSLASSFASDRGQWSAPDRPSAAGSAPPSRRPQSGAPRHRVPFPHAPDLPNASLGGAPPTGGSQGIFAMMLLAFALTAPWWVRRRLPSALRRLMAVVSRLERPG